MNFTWVAMLIAGVLFAAMLLTFELGRRIGTAQLAKDPDGLAKGVGAAEGAVFALLGLLMAGTFSGAASRFEGRRLMIDTEANAIGTAYLRIDVLPDDAQPELRQLFRRYLENRIEVYRDWDDVATTDVKLAEGATVQRAIWTAAVAAGRRPDANAYAPMLLLPALNQMIDITTVRAVARQNHPPQVIYYVLAGLSLVSALLVGHVTAANKVRNWFYLLLFAITMSITFYLILDLEFPREGLIRVDASDQTMVDLRRLME
jgi:hypothetical protein